MQHCKSGTLKQETERWTVRKTESWSGIEDLARACASLACTAFNLLCKCVGGSVEEVQSCLF